MQIVVIKASEETEYEDGRECQPTLVEVQTLMCRGMTLVCKRVRKLASLA